MAGVAVLTKTQRTVLTSIGENTFCWRFVERDEFSQQFGTRSYLAKLEFTAAVAPDAHRIEEEQRLAVEVYAGWRGPVRHRRKAIQAPLLIAQTDPLPLFRFCHNRIILENSAHKGQLDRLVGRIVRRRHFAQWRLDKFMQRPINEQLSKAVNHAGSRSRVYVIYRPLSELTLDPKNPRTHSLKRVRQIARSIQTFGFNVPVLVDAKHKVIAGHGRILACQLLGWTEVPTICLDRAGQRQRALDRLDAPRGAARLSGLCRPG
jgi:hypothetical protein